MPALWDMSGEVYSDRDEKQKGWLELVELFIEKENSTEEEKMNLELELQVKAHGIPVSEFTWQPTTPSTVINTYIKSNSVPSDAHKESLVGGPGRHALYLQMPDVVTEAATLTASQVEDLMEDDHPVNGDPMLSSLDVSSPASHRTTGHQSITEDDDDDSLAVDMDLVA